MDQKLNNAAQAGDIDTLYSILTLDPLLFETIDRFPFSQTPLHVAVLAGQTSFLMELLNLKPSFIRKLNTDGYSPIHLASIEGQVEMVRELLAFDHELGFLKGREWRTPLHCAVINGRVEVVNELLLSGSSSEWLKALTVRKETVLHLALKYGKMEVFELLVEGIKDKKVEEMVNWKDRDGNTILHLAASSKQFQIMELLVKDNPFAVDTDMKNLSGLTAMDILRQHSTNENDNEEIQSILVRIDAVRPQHTVVSMSTALPARRTTSNTSIEPLIILEVLFKGLPMEKWAKEIENSPSETRSALMVVAVLIATVTFQVALSPPGDFKEKRLVHPPYPPAIFMVNRGCIDLFTSLNLIGFVTSIAMITVLTKGFPLKALLRLAVLSMTGTFLCCVAYFNTQDLAFVTIVALVMLTILLIQWIHFTIRSLKNLVYVTN